ncbi:unnamed protein product [Linum trigynum]|uniref:Uncharacterized protein n=1 Tax=Linum trigynum TaxID=586398 RepID=A0AAV2EPJ6_9ROSI
MPSPLVRFLAPGLVIVPGPRHQGPPLPRLPAAGLHHSSGSWRLGPLSFLDPGSRAPPDRVPSLLVRFPAPEPVIVPGPRLPGSALLPAPKPTIALLSFLDPLHVLLSAHVSCLYSISLHMTKVFPLGRNMVDMCTTTWRAQIDLEEICPVPCTSFISGADTCPPVVPPGSYYITSSCSPVKVRERDRGKYPESAHCNQ